MNRLCPLHPRGEKPPADVLAATIRYCRPCAEVMAAAGRRYRTRPIAEIVAGRSLAELPRLRLIELATRAKRDIAARSWLAEQLQPMALRIARRYAASTGEDVDELFGYAQFGVLDAIRRFDPARGELHAIASMCIRRAIRNGTTQLGTRNRWRLEPLAQEDCA